MGTYSMIKMMSTKENDNSFIIQKLKYPILKTIQISFNLRTNMIIKISTNMKCTNSLLGVEWLLWCICITTWTRSTLGPVEQWACLAVMAKDVTNTTSTLFTYRLVLNNRLILTDGCTRLSCGWYATGIWATETVVPGFATLSTVLNPSNLSCWWYSYLFRSTRLSSWFWRKDNHTFHLLRHFPDGHMGDRIDRWGICCL